MASDVLCYLERSYEKGLLFWLEKVDQFCQSTTTDYALFGGAAVGGYTGHLPRKLHDLDVISDAKGSQAIESFLREHRFEQQNTIKAREADYTKFIRRNHLYEMIISIFPSRFTLINVDNEQLPILDVYDFSFALQRRRRLSIRSLADDKLVAVNVIALEDLIISKLWPTFEPNTVHDLLLLLGSNHAAALDDKYLSKRLRANPRLQPLMSESLRRFERSYPTTCWARLADLPTRRALRVLKENIGTFPPA